MPHSAAVCYRHPRISISKSVPWAATPIMPLPSTSCGDRRHVERVTSVGNGCAPESRACACSTPGRRAGLRPRAPPPPGSMGHRSSRVTWCPWREDAPDTTNRQHTQRCCVPRTRPFGFRPYGNCPSRVSFTYGEERAFRTAAAVARARLSATKEPHLHKSCWFPFAESKETT
jgi:hypothetical protein